MADFYNAGTVSLTAGSATVNGVNTGWAAVLRAGDVFEKLGLSITIKSVNANGTSLVLEEAWPGATIANTTYRVRYAPDAKVIEGKLTALLDTLGNGNLYSFAQIAGAADRVPIFTGAGVLSAMTVTAWARGLLNDPDVDTARTTLGVPSAANAQLTGTTTMSRGIIGTLTSIGAADAAEGVLLVSNRLEVSRNDSVPVYIRRTGTDGGAIIFNKDAVNVASIGITANGVAYNTTSDYRLKPSVEPLVTFEFPEGLTPALARLMRLRPVRHNWTAAPDLIVHGFIAHELQAVVPAAVTGAKDAVDADGNPEMQQVDLTRLIADLTAAMQELTLRVIDRDSTIDALTQRLAALEAARSAA